MFFKYRRCVCDAAAGWYVFQNACTDAAAGGLSPADFLTVWCLPAYCLLTAAAFFPSRVLSPSMVPAISARPIISETTGVFTKPAIR